MWAGQWIFPTRDWAVFNNYSHVEQLLFIMVRVQRIVLYSSDSKKEKASFLAAVIVVAKYIVRKSPMIGVATDRFPFSFSIIRYFSSHFKRKIKLQRECLSYYAFVKIVKTLVINGFTLICTRKIEKLQWWFGVCCGQIIARLTAPSNMYFILHSNSLLILVFSSLLMLFHWISRSELLYCFPLRLIPRGSLNVYTFTRSGN